ncbi:hypothetical protein [Novosphingobium sp.]|uniref:hypothetical protein n=1 Tax=Novosphingobium sp. TaxID=1874826 RepID=UPI0027359650|nr:hypothetical protein [Novosphingobium sp.]MDP3908628.1 hypothetical protein [Novosphingobium sp.]
MALPTRPAAAWLFAVLLLIGAGLTAFFGLSANGYLVPAAMLAIMAALLWLGRAGGLFKAVAIINLISGAVLVLTLAFGDVLGDRKLDVSGVALLVNLLTGGPLLGLLAPGLLLGLRTGKALNQWFNPAAIAA